MTTTFSTKSSSKSLSLPPVSVKSPNEMLFVDSSNGQFYSRHYDPLLLIDTMNKSPSTILILLSMMILIQTCCKKKQKGRNKTKNNSNRVNPSRESDGTKSADGTTGRQTSGDSPARSLETGQKSSGESKESKSPAGSGAENIEGGVGADDRMILNVMQASNNTNNNKMNHQTPAAEAEITQKTKDTVTKSSNDTDANADFVKNDETKTTKPPARESEKAGVGRGGGGGKKAGPISWIKSRLRRSHKKPASKTPAGANRQKTGGEMTTTPPGTPPASPKKYGGTKRKQSPGQDSLSSSPSDSSSSSPSNRPAAVQQKDKHRTKNVPNSWRRRRRPRDQRRNHNRHHNRHSFPIRSKKRHNQPPEQGLGAAEKSKSKSKSKSREKNKNNEHVRRRSRSKDKRGGGGGLQKGRKLVKKYYDGIPMERNLSSDISIEREGKDELRVFNAAENREDGTTKLMRTQEARNRLTRFTKTICLRPDQLAAEDQLDEQKVDMILPFARLGLAFFQAPPPSPNPAAAATKQKHTTSFTPSASNVKNRNHEEEFENSGDSAGASGLGGPPLQPSKGGPAASVTTAPKTVLTTTKSAVSAASQAAPAQPFDFGAVNLPPKNGDGGGK